MVADTKKDINGKDNFAEVNPFQLLTKTFEQFKMPGFDTNSFVNARRKDLEAMVTANKTTYESLQAIAAVQSTMLTEAMKGMQQYAKGAMPDAAEGSDMTSQAAAAQKVWHKMLADMKQLAEMVQKAQVEVMTGLAARAKESMSEMNGLAHTK